jgi:hypothetical protein
MRRVVLSVALFAVACSSSSSDPATTDAATSDSASTPGYYCESSLDDCTCIGASTGKTTPGAVCDDKKFAPVTVCCAAAGYPRDGTVCQCVTWGCSDPGGSCYCSLASASTPDLKPSCPSDYTRCCLDAANGSCTCDRLSSLPCSGGKTSVPSCSVDLAARCPNISNLRVKSCT